MPVIYSVKQNIKNALRYTNLIMQILYKYNNAVMKWEI